MAERKRDYRAEYLAYHGKPEQIKKRDERNAARNAMEKKVGKAALKGKDVDHKIPLDRGGSNKMSNLRVSTVKANRDWRKGKSGYNA